MDKILTDIDNKTHGAIINQIIEYIFPDYSCFGDKNDIRNFSMKNKYLNKIIQRERKCSVMDKILIDIDNKTPGAIINQIIEYIFPDCSRFGNKNDIRNFSMINKYFNKIIRRERGCSIKKLCGRLECKKHSPNFVIMNIIHDKIQKAKNDLTQGWIHFNSKEQAIFAQKFVSKDFYIRGSCCFGKGLCIR